MEKKHSAITVSCNQRGRDRLLWASVNVEAWATFGENTRLGTFSKVTSRICPVGMWC